jgi:hypothetical protein
MKDNQSHYAGKQPRIDTAEKQRGANNPRPLPKEESEKRKHPGYPG